MNRSRAYYNEYDKKAAAWLRDLIASGLIMEGDVDERSIVDVRSTDLAGYTQCHFFAGIGGWPLALSIAGWPRHWPVWTGSCPCPPFSSAGKGQQCPECGSKSNICHPRKTGHFVCLDCGCDRHADDRHLWPEFARLIRQSDAPVCFGEQVASADGRLWLAAVRADVETMGRAIGGADLCSAGIGAPNIRQRLWFVTEALADAECCGFEAGKPARQGAGAALPHGVTGGMEHPESDGRLEWRPEPGGRSAAGGCGDGRLADLECFGRERGRTSQEGVGEGSFSTTGGFRDAGGLADTGRGLLQHQQRLGNDAGPSRSAEGEAREQQWRGSGDRDGGLDGWVADALRDGAGNGPGEGLGAETAPHGIDGDLSWQRLRPRVEGPVDELDHDGRPRAPHEFWRDPDWLFCRDEFWRPVRPGSFPLAHGVPARVVRLRGYGNAINPYVAAEFIGAWLDAKATNGESLRKSDTALSRRIDDFSDLLG